MKTVSIIAVLATSGLLVACSNFPDLDGTVSPGLDKADFPRLVPVEPLLAASEDVQITDQTTAQIAARVARLKARAARLRRTVVDRGTRARMRDGVAPIEG